MVRNLRSIRLAFALLAGITVASEHCCVHGALTVRVDAGGGAPRWAVNGEPKRARVFFGAPGPSQIAVSPEPQAVSFDFVALGSATNATLHFRFGQAPG